MGCEVVCLEKGGGMRERRWVCLYWESTLISARLLSMAAEN